MTIMVHLHKYRQIAVEISMQVFASGECALVDFVGVYS